MEIYSGYLPELPAIFKETSEHEKWLIERSKHFTGSAISDLMSCSQSTAKLEWGRPEKLIDFGKTARKYIYEVAKEIQTGKVIKSASSVEMRYGQICEPLIKDVLREKFPEYIFENCGFIEHEKVKILGATPDGKVKMINKTVGLEIKASCNFGTVYDRIILPFDKSHTDFWQIQTEMLVLNVDTIMYVVALPSEDIFNPIIEKDGLEIKFVNASPIHQKCILQRAEIGKAAIDLFLQGEEFSDAITMAASNYKIEA